MDSITTTGRYALIIAGGDPVDREVTTTLPHGAFVVAADSGLDHATRLGIPVDLVIGDMDSVSPAGLDAARAAGAKIETHPTDKDATDLELAIDAVMALGFTRIVLLGGRGGRLDHLLGNALVLTGPRLGGISIEWRFARTTVTPVRPGRGVALEGKAGDIVSILPVGGDALGVTTTGLKWPLSDDTLHSGSTRGISNTMQTRHAAVALTSGTALVIHERNA